LQAFKVIVPPHDPPEPYEPAVHEGYEWLYVLSGRVHLVLGPKVVDLGPGEVVEFDTRTPHVVANTRDHPAEFLALFGPQGERMHVRTGT
jgi:mannose-6-phosphate isomerase-like protein (cupin superfamily)